MNPLLTLSGTRLAQLIRTREVTSLEVVETHIAHIQKVNPRINAVVKDRFEEARAEARGADRRLPQIDPEALPPFHGVPCTIKEAFALTGMPNTSGLMARKGIIASQDAPTVARLRSAGAIPLGVTNTSELCMWMESHNRVYGRSNNPYNVRHTVGGSSGGEGAIIGAGGSPFGLGADIGGSIRMPAFFNGVFGHKPTGRMVPGTGQYPLASGVALRYLVTGPLARRAEDLMPLLRVLAGPDAGDPECIPFTLQEPDEVDLSSLTVIDVEEQGPLSVSRDLSEARKRCVDALKRRGANVRQVRLESFAHAFFIWGTMVTAGGGPTYASILGNGQPVNIGREFLRWCLRRSPHTLPSLVLTLLERHPVTAPGKSERFIRLGEELRQEVLELLGPHGVMLFPSHRYPAPRHLRPLLTPFNWVFTGIFNVLELPVTQVPLGLNARGLPLGIQVVGRHGQDHVTIAVAKMLEQEFGGWIPPHFDG